jgi:SulP family sulfate permease
VIFSHVNEQPMREFHHSGVFEMVGEEFFQPNIDAALEKAMSL